MSITKNRQSFENIQRMVEKAFPDKVLQEAKELLEGYCNVTYRILFEDGSTAILKIGAESMEGNLTNEKGLMFVETSAMKFMEQHKEVTAPKVLFYDTSRTLCSGDYFFMSTIDGDNFANVSGQMTEDEKNLVYQEIGQTIHKLGDIRQEKFGILGREEYDSLYDFYKVLLNNLVDDARPVWEKAALCFSEEELFERLLNDKPYFDEVKKASLIHWDIWDGNIFVKGGHVSGVIDWERTMWAEAIMCDQFRSHSRKEAMLKGYGQDSFSDSEKRRMAWYDLLLFTTMIVEGIYRKYDTDELAEGVRPFLNKAWETIKSGN